MFMNVIQKWLHLPAAIKNFDYQSHFDVQYSADPPSLGQFSWK